jgi:hypothetical protein
MSRKWLVLSLMAALAVPSLSSAQNLLTNPGFEASGGSYDGWTLIGSGAQISTSETDNIIRSGAAAAKVFGEFTGCPAEIFDVGGFLQTLTSPTAGKIYELSGYAYVSSIDPMEGTDTCANNRMVAKLAFFNAPTGGSEISVNEIVIGDGNSVVDQWNPFSVSAPVPAGAQRLEVLFLFLQPGCAEGSVFVDDTVLLELDPPASTTNILNNPSFTSGLAGWNVFGNVVADTRSFAVYTAPGSAKLYGPFALAGDASGMYQSFAASAGSVWRLDVFSMHTCQGNPPERTLGDNFGMARIVFRDALNNEIVGNDSTNSDEVVIIDETSPLATWTEHGVIATAPAGAVTVEAFILYVQPDSLEAGSMFVDEVRFRQLETTDVALAPTPRRFELHQNEPNPFNPSTRIDFVLSERDAVDLSIYDVAGRRIVTLFRGPLDVGPHQVTWDGKAANGVPVAAGTYRYVLRTSTGRQSRSMVLIK